MRVTINWNDGFDRGWPPPTFRALCLLGAPGAAERSGGCLWWARVGQRIYWESCSRYVSAACDVFISKLHNQAFRTPTTNYRWHHADASCASCLRSLVLWGYRDGYCEITLGGYVKNTLIILSRLGPEFQSIGCVMPTRLDSLLYMI